MPSRKGKRRGENERERERCTREFWSVYAMKTLVTMARFPSVSCVPRFALLSHNRGWCRGSCGMHNLRFSPPSWASNKRQISNTVQAALQIDLVPCLVDNYAYLLHDSASGVTGVVDPSAAGPVIDALNKRGLSLTYILNTHHHWDHTGGNAELKKKYNAKVVGPRADEERIPGIDLALRDGQIWMFGEQEMRVLDTPGHTRGHVSFYFKQSKAVFTGDTLFSIGCGRLFEGSPEQMWMSLSKLAGLPDDTLVYCGHEYTLSNAKFAITVEPDNKRLKSRLEQVKELRQKGLATIPSTLGEEKETNPFLRPFSAGLRKTMKVPADASDIQAFAAVRAAKDRA